MSPFALAVALLFIFLSVSSADEKQLYRDIFKDYEISVRPRLDSSQTVVVTIDLEISQIKALDEKSQTLQTVGFIQSAWYDDYLKWDPANYSGIKQLITPPHVHWLPDFGVHNSAEKFYDEDYFQFFRTSVGYDGLVIWAFGGVFQTTCEIDTLLFPFDIQSCAILIENWAYDNNSVLLLNGTDGVRLDTYHQNGIWDLIHNEVKAEEITLEIAPNETYSQLRFVLHLKRKPRYYMVNIVIPCTFLTSIALLVFWLPPEAGEKVSLGVTVLLAFSVFQLIIAGSTPENSDSTPILSIFVTLTMALSTLSVVTTVLVLQLHHRGSHEKIPKWIKVVAFDFLARIMCMSLGNRKDEKDSDGENPRYSFSPGRGNNGGGDSDDVVSLLAISSLEKTAAVAPAFRALAKQVEGVTAELKFLTSRLHERELEKEAESEWQALAKVLDRLLFWVVLIILVSALAWLMVTSARSNVTFHDH